MAKKKIAVLGGGVSALTAAFEITEQPNWQEEYDITVYQMGWRLGGKGASGRNQQTANRIQEHGLHIWMGFYENAFDMMRRAYAYCTEQGLTPGSPFRTYLDAFSKLNLTVIPDKYKGEWSFWNVLWQKTTDVPGQDNLNDSPPTFDFSTPWGFIEAIVEKILMDFGDLFDGYGAFKTVVSGLIEDIMALLEKDTPGGEPSGGQRLAYSFTGNSRVVLPNDDDLKELVRKLRTFVDWCLDFVDDLLGANPDVRHNVTAWDIGVSFIAGMIQDDVLTKGFGVIDNVEFRDWLKRNGSREADSGLVSCLYDGAFGYKGGSVKNMAAGSALHAGLRLMFTYRGSIMWWMNAGMGDTIFTPIYLALKHRGVKFEFFNKVTDVIPSGDGKSIGQVKIAIQAHIRPENADGYNPLIPVNGLLCWPATPLYDQLVEANQLQNPNLINPDIESWWTDAPTFGERTLTSGQDFDTLVLGISIGAFPYICKKLIAADKTGAWADMVSNVKTVRTQAFQLWLKKTPQQVGWSNWQAEPPVMCGFSEPFDTWGDVSHLIPRESWPQNAGCVQIAYYCDAAPDDPNEAAFNDPHYPAQQLAVIRQNAINYIEGENRAVWSNFNWGDLVSLQPASADSNAIDTQFIRVNIDPTERYVLSVTGSTKNRLLSWDSRFTNLVLAGDWTLTNLSVGCVEAAVQSGRMAAFAVCSAPNFVYGSYRSKLPLERSAAART